MAQCILIVDDEKEIVSMLYRYFSRLGYTVYTATAGKAALKEAEKNPDISNYCGCVGVPFCI